ncbi:DUF1707 SHOCT-like domain-containing protein [Salinactinospora qingdaonensis]|uniref:DUF1707 domain-containing protein n=1 Tax=Salinactinospora qingdaonensis TaxID=702744 RepID=A0ABP7FQP5_9ACTN
MSAASNGDHESNPTSRMRVSDADRDRIAHRLREALAEGRITAQEHTERLEATYTATTAGELLPLVSDLPTLPPSPTEGDAAALTGLSGAPRPIYGRERIGGRASGRFSAALMGVTERAGTWTLPETYVAMTVMGAIGLDLRESRFAAREVTIYANVVMGAIEVIVPDDVEVRVHGVGIMGSFATDGKPAGVTEPGAPIVHVTGIAVMGAVEVARKPRQHQPHTDDDSDD